MSNSDDVLIKVENVSKKFCRSLKRSMLYGIADISRDLLHLPNTSDKLRKDEFWAVDDVSFEVKRGECLGIIGRNGAGKSTLLKMLNGIILPDNGKITIKGKVGALIEVGAGFHPMLTGRENIYVNGAILGMSKREIDQKFDEIVAFAELEEFIDMPVKHYSSGMYVRLGFAIAVHSVINILIIDEVLAVGDNNFRAKCLKKIQNLMQSGISIIFVSHEMQLINRIAKQAILIEKNKGIFQGKSSEITEKYYKNLAINNERHIIQNTSIAIKSVRVFGDRKEVYPGEPFNIEVKYECYKRITGHLSFALHDLSGQQIAAFRTDDDGKCLHISPSEGTFRLSIRNNPLSPGHYYISLRIFDNHGFYLLLDHYMSYSYYIRGLKKTVGILELEHNWYFSYEE